MTGGPASSLLKGHGFEVADVYRPPAFHIKDGRLLSSGMWLIKYYAYYKKCKKIAARLIKKQNPEMVVADEDMAALIAAEYSGTEMPRVLITDILESRFTGRVAGIMERRMNGAMRNIMNKCDIVIMPQDGTDRGNLRMVGPVVRHISESREELREKFDMAGRTILVTVGGTDAGRFLLHAMEKVAADLQDRANTIFEPGPALGSGIMHDMHEKVMAADVVVSLAGRSTMDEAAVYGTPGVFIPISGHFEQEDNAARRGFSHKDIGRLQDIILQKLDEPRRPSDGDGARRAARTIQSLI